MSTKLPVRTLTVFLTKKGVDGVAALDLTQRVFEHTVISLDAATKGDLYTYSVPSHHPNWAGFFGDRIDPKKLHLFTSSASAILVIQRQQRTFALTFGYARHCVRRDAVEGTFGLRVALNSIEEDAIRSIDRKTFEGVTTHVREQASKQTTLASFGVDVDRDLLRAVVGTPTDPAIGKRISGMDALSATVAVDLASVPQLLDQFLAVSAQKKYRKKYAWIDNIQEVRDPKLVEALENKLVTEIVAGDFNRKWLAVPDILEWDDIEGFCYNKGDAANLESDIHFSSYLESIRSPDALTWDRMKNHRVRCFSSTNSQVIHDWPLTECVYAELEIGSGSYLLNAGAWFQLDTNFVSRLDATIAAIPSTATQIVDYQDGESEATYNKRLSKSLKGACLMDAKQVPYGGGHSTVEYCDVLTQNHVLIHVKRYSGSSVLSHLFAQGLVSATAFASDAEFRKALNGKLPTSFRLSNTAQRPRVHSYEVAYVIASRSQSKLVLPLFSRVTLKNARQRLEALGYKVSLTKVAVV